MAKIENSMLLLATLEHSNKEDKILHQNKHENGLKFWGIYESMHPDWAEAYIDKINEVKA